MIITCQKCGKKYRLAFEIRKNQGKQFTCHSCHAVIPVIEAESRPRRPIQASTRIARPEAFEPEPQVLSSSSAPMDYTQKSKSLALGITGKFLIFILAPLFLIYGYSTYLSTKKTTETQAITVKESLKMNMQMSEKAIIEHARSVAMQVGLLLASRPTLARENFTQDVDFKRVAIQRVGLTGYSLLLERPHEGSGWRIWTHPDPTLVGPMDQVEKALGKNFSDFFNVIKQAETGLESQGTYHWFEKDDLLRDKFMVCTPVEGTYFLIGSTAYLDEYTMPVTRLDLRMQGINREMRLTNIVTMSLGLLVIALIIFFYGRELTGKIKRLSFMADRISVGDMQAEVIVSSKDEIGELADAIMRMKDSINISLERLRRK